MSSTATIFLRHLKIPPDILDCSCDVLSESADYVMDTGVSTNARDSSIQGLWVFKDRAGLGRF